MSAYRQAADKGSTSAMVELGVMFGTGTGVPKDEAQARTLFERAAAAGNPRGVTNLAALGGAPSDPASARALLARSADTNSAEAQYQLGLMIAEGVGGPKDDVTARLLFERQPRKVIPGRWSGWAHLHKAVGADRAIQVPLKRITRRPRRSVMKMPRRLLRARDVPSRSKINAENL
jgi:hypothetical protein